MSNYRISFLLLLSAMLFICPAQAQQGKAYRLFYLGGQSNMDGYGFNKDLPDSLKNKQATVRIFHGNPAPDESLEGGLGMWTALSPGHGRGFSSDGKTNVLSDRFGCELSLAKTLQRLFPGENIAFIKYSRGGTSIDTVVARQFGAWDPDFRGKNGINQYDHFLTTINAAFAQVDIDGDGAIDQLVPSGIFWMQGESDAATEAVARRYPDNLKRLMDLIRAAFRSDDLPIVIGKISDSNHHERGKVWPFGELVMYAQEQFVAQDEKAAIVRSTKHYKHSDPWHYDSAGYIDMGKRFAEAMYGLISQP